MLLLFTKLGNIIEISYGCGTVYNIKRIRDLGQYAREVTRIVGKSNHVEKVWQYY